MKTIQTTSALGFSNIGQRANNEDSIFPKEGEANPHQRWFVVCDGVGGHQKGEEASRRISRSLGAYFESNLIETADAAYIEQAVDFAQKSLDDYLAIQPFADGMGTTMVLIYFNQNKTATIAHIGDSRGYHVRQGQIYWQSKDHSFVNDLIDAGVINAEQARVHPKRNIITRALQGSNVPVKAEVRIIEDIEVGDYFFLCTDGVLEQVTDEWLGQLLKKPISNDEKLALLLENCRDKTRDNYSGYLIQIAAI